MKRILCMLLCVFLTAKSAYIFAYANTAELYADASVSLQLPASLTAIEDSAFEGTAAFSVLIPNTVSHIDDRAFGHGLLRLIGFAGSYADQWSKTHNVPFVKLGMMFFLPGKGFVKAVQILIYGFVQNIIHFEKGYMHHWVKHADLKSSMRPQERPELHAIDYRFP